MATWTERAAAALRAQGIDPPEGFYAGCAEDNGAPIPPGDRDRAPAEAPHSPIVMALRARAPLSMQDFCDARWNIPFADRQNAVEEWAGIAKEIASAHLDDDVAVQNDCAAQDFLRFLWESET